MEFASTKLAEDTRATHDLPIWKLSVDGAANAQGSDVGLILTSPEGIDIEYALRFGFQASNNEAEYEAVIGGLNLAHSMEVDQLEVRHIPRAENSRADALAKLATASQEDLSKLMPGEHLVEPSIDLYDEEVAPVMSEPSLMDPIWDYLIEGLLLNDPKEASKLRTRSARFTIHRGSLYKRGFFTPILKCIAGKDADYVLREVHEGICGNHIGARALAGKALRQGYYWPTMLRDAIELVRKCKICQEHAKISHLPSEPLTSVTSPWPFQQWGLDILGLLPIGTGQCKFIIVAVDYFTKWTEAEPLATITEQKIRTFVWSSIICKFGIPRALVSDNGNQFDNPKFRDFYAELGIKNYYSSPTHPQSNGQAEVTVEYIKGQHLYRILIPSAHILLSFYVRIGAFDRSRVFMLVRVFRVPHTLFIGVRVQRTNVDHCG